jgi:hypothetical protein
MRKIILVFSLLFVSFTVVPQNKQVDTIVEKSNKIDQEIEKVIQKNDESIEFIRAVSENNQKKMQDI